MGHAPFTHPYRVTYADCTVGNHIYYGRHLELLEAARGEFFRSLGQSLLAWQEQDAIFPVIEARLRYRQLARYDDALVIAVWPTLVDRVRLNFASRITRPADGALIHEADTFHACTTLAGKPRRLPEPLAALLRPLCPPPAPPAA